MNQEELIYSTKTIRDKIIGSCVEQKQIAYYGCTDAEIAKSFIEDVRAVKDLLPQEREDEK